MHSAGDVSEDYQDERLRRLYSPTIEAGEVILVEIAGQLNVAPTVESARYTAGLSELIISKYAYLTEEQRARKFGRIIGKALRKIAKEKSNNSTSWALE